MPRLAAFYGIVIWMYRPDHFHARYGEDEAQVEPGTLRVINGSLGPARYDSCASGQSFTKASS